MRTAPDLEPDENLDDLDQLDVEAPRDDAVEQRVSAIRPEREPVDGPEADEVIEADPADAADQRRVVEGDEDDYR
ncbi:hypothetical protein GTW78_19255 [Streptomyces sp. SID4948]|nr:hypothetical protein [Streptomyces sp. SID4948]